MIRAFTVFDTYSRKPIMSITDQDGQVDYYVFYLRGTGNTLKFVEDEKKRFIKCFDGPVIINNFKEHIKQFNLPRNLTYEVYDVADIVHSNEITDTENGKIQLNLILSSLKQIQPEPWRKLLADSSVVYQYLEDVGVRDRYDQCWPQYGFTFTGRARTSGFSLHSASSDHNIKPVSDDYNLYIHLDWIAADMRAAGVLSNDETLNSTFVESDPYSFLANKANKDRNQCKISLLKSIYSLNASNRVLDYFPTFQKWIIKTVDDINNDKPVHTFMGRPFVKDDTHDVKSVFNATIQGTVAHAMQNVICQLYKSFPQCLLAEIYDSLVLVCNQSLLKPVLAKAISAMRNPFKNVAEHNPTFPLIVSIGNQWRQWKEFKTIR